MSKYLTEKCKGEAWSLILWNPYKYFEAELSLS